MQRTARGIVLRRHRERVRCTLFCGCCVFRVHWYRCMACGVCVAYMMEYVRLEMIARRSPSILCVQNTHIITIFNDGWTVWLEFNHFFFAPWLRFHSFTAYGIALAAVARYCCYLAIFRFLLNIYVWLWRLFHRLLLLLLWLESLGCRRASDEAGIPKFVAFWYSVATKWTRQRKGGREGEKWKEIQRAVRDVRLSVRRCVIIQIVSIVCLCAAITLCNFVRIKIEYCCVDRELSDSVYFLCAFRFCFYFFVSSLLHWKINTYRTCAIEWLTDWW